MQGVVAAMTGGLQAVAHHHHQPALLYLLVPAALLLLLHFMATRRRRRSSNDNGNKHHHQLPWPPSPPGRLPIIGHLHLVGSRPHVSLRDLAARHGRGGLLLLRLGAVPNLVASSPRAAEAVLRTHDYAFASRATTSVSDGLLYGSSDIGFAPYGHHWRQARKLVTTHLFTASKVRAYRGARAEEVRLVIAKIRREAAAAAAVDMSEAMNSFANDVISRAVSGKFFRAEGRNKLFRELVETITRLVGGFNLLEDYFPALAASLTTTRWLRFLRLGNSKAIAEAHRRWDELLETILCDHETKNNSMHRRHGDGGQGDFTDVLLSVQHEYGGITRDHVKAILMDMFGAGTDTSSLTLELALAELMRNPRQRAKLQDEVRKHTPEGQEMVEEENLGSMPYLRAVVKETLRLHPPAPLLLPHLSMADCVVEGYSVPSGTRVTVNAWAIGRDPEAWEKPEEFMPERFMDGGSAAAVDFRGNDFQLLPFGAGRRICPGLNFGVATVEIMLANLMHCFDWQLPVGMEEKDIDTTEALFGLTMHPKQKLMLVPKLRGGT
ncbi:hypothetical protein BS78_07G004900 [Paspalum vaginatum]|nr:hypothetical protein BS78_07G004900 [Paspalum vaginatum]